MVKEKDKYKGKRLQKLFIITMLFMQFFTMMTPVLQVFAEDEDDVEEVEDSGGDSENKELKGTSRKGNVFSGNNEGAINAFKESSKYDPMMHYLVTYNTLDSKISDKDSESSYYGITSGKVDRAYKGNGEELVNENNKSTNINELLGGEEIDQVLNAGDTNVNEEGESLSDKELQGLRETIAEGMAEAVMNALHKERVSINITEGDLFFDNEKVLRPQYNINENRPTGGMVGDWFSTSYGNIGVAEIEPSVIQGGLSRTDKVMVDSVYKEKLASYLLENRIKSMAGVSEEKYGGLKKGILSDIVNAENSYIAQEAGGADIKLNISKTGIYQTPTSGLKTQSLWRRQLDVKDLNTYVKSNKDAKDLGEVSNLPTDDNVEGSVPTYKFLLFSEGVDDKETSGNSAEDKGYIKFTKTTAVKVINNSFMWTLREMPITDSNGKKINSDIERKIVEAYNSYVKSDSNIKEYKETIKKGDKETEKNAENVMVLGWTPLHIDAEWGKHRGVLAERLEKSDPQAKVTESGITIEGDPRPLMTKDIFIEESKYSPVLIGAKNTDYPKPYDSGVRLTVGKSSGNLVIGKSEISNSIRHRVNKKGDIGKLTEKGKPDSMTDSQETILGYTSLVDTGGVEINGKLVGKDNTVGVDNYGNVISGDTGDVIVPYWQNQLFADSELNDYYFPYSPIVASEGKNVDTEDDLLKTTFNIQGLAKPEEIKDFIKEIEGKGDGKLSDHALKAHKYLKDKGGVSLGEAQEYLVGNVLDITDRDANRALAVVIAASTKDAVIDWNKKMMEDAEAGSEFYVGFSKMMYEGEGENSENEMMRWTAASLIQKAGWVRDYGMGDTIRLTLISTMTRIYNETIADAGLEFIFYTDNVTNSEDWENVSVLIASLIGLTISLYLLYTGFKAYRGEVRWGKVATKVVILATILLYPMLAYGNMMDYMINKPSTYILGNQMRLSVVLDTYFTRTGTKRNINEYYENMFGKYEDSDAMQLGSYNLKFYTMTDKAGFDINTTSPDDSSLNIMERARLGEYHSGRSEYPKSNLIYVEVPLMDMYRWVWDVRYGGEGVESEEYKDRYPTYEEIVESGDVLPLFEWLGNNGGEHFVVEGYSEEIAEYEEYKVIPELVKPGESVDPYVTEGLTTYGAAYQEFEELERGGESERKVPTGEVEAILGTNGNILTASELMYGIIMNSSSGDVASNLGNLDGLSDLRASPDDRDANYYVPTEADVRALVRDLSNTREGRRLWYGESKGWSNFTKAVLDGDEGTDGVFMDYDGEHRDLGKSVRIIPPEEDFLGLTSIVEQYTPSQGEYNPYDRKMLEEQVSKINSNLLNNYLSTYAITKRSLGDKVEDKDMLDHAEKMVMATEAYFQFNKSLGFRHFPTEYAVDSIKFDKYLALLFIPFNEYGQETMQFFDGEKVVPMTTAEYVAMSSNVASNFLFYIAVVMLIMFGLAYIGILYFGLLVYSMVNFIKFYIIKDDYSNKSALGSIMIMTVLSLSKNAVMLIIWAGSWIMNKTIAMSEFPVPTYPVVPIHSLAIIVALGVIFKVVLMPTWKGVMNDKDNMGGQFFSDKASEVKAKLTPTGLLPGGGSGVNGGSAASKFGSSSKSPDNSLKSNAGKLGNKGASGLNKMRKKATKAVGATGMFAGGMMIGGRKGNANQKSLEEGRGLSRMVGSVNDAITGKKDDYRGIDGVNRKKIDPKKVSANSKLDRMSLSSLGRGMNNLVHTVGGLADTAVSAAEVGAELASFKSDAVTKMGLGSAAAAGLVAQSLMKKGITAKQVGNDVLFDSSGYDLEDAGVRGELFNNSVADLQEMTEGRKAEILDREIDSSEASNYSYIQGDGTIDLDFNKKRGFHEETFNDLMKTEDFGNLFIRPNREDLIVNSRGHIEGIKKGALRLRNPGASATDVQAGMDQIYQTEQKLREEKGLGLREDRERMGSNIHGVSPEYFKNEIAPLVEGVKGMDIQGSRISYSGSNLVHSKVMNRVEDKVREHNEGVDSTYGDASSKMMQYVVKDGKNQGFEVETEKAGDNNMNMAMLHGSMDYAKDISKYKVDEGKLPEIEKNVNVARGLSKIAKGKGKKSVEEFVQVKEDMRTLLKNESINMGGKDHRTFSQEMVDYADATGMRNTDSYRAVQSNIDEIERQYRQKHIDDNMYRDKMARENKNMMGIMDSTGNLDGFILSRYDKNNPYIKAFEESAEQKMKRDGKDYKSIEERYNESMVDLNKELERKDLMSMPLGMARSAIGASQEEFNIDSNGILTHKSDEKSKRTTLDGEDKEAIRSYLMGEDIKVDKIKEVVLDTN